MRSACGFAFALGLLATCSRPAHAQQWGTIKGQIVFKGDKIPIAEDLIDSVKKNNDQKHCLEKGPIHGEEWIVNPKNNGIANVFVWLGPADPKKRTPLPVHPRLVKIEQLEVVMDQPHCRFVPHAVALREGQILIAKNSAPVPHNFHYSGHPDVNPGENPLIPSKGQHVIKGLRADRLAIGVKCSFHPWMKAWVRVFNHPYFALTNTDGMFEIKDAPAGDWRLFVWHEAAGWGAIGVQGMPVTIQPAKTAEHKINLNQ